MVDIVDGLGEVQGHGYYAVRLYLLVEAIDHFVCEWKKGGGGGKRRSSRSRRCSRSLTRGKGGRWGDNNCQGLRFFRLRGGG